MKRKRNPLVPDSSGRQSSLLHIILKNHFSLYERLPRDHFYSDRKNSSSPPAFVACGMIPSFPAVNIPIHLLVPPLMARSPGLHVVGRLAGRGTRPETGALESEVRWGRLSIWREAGKGSAALRLISSSDAAAAAAVADPPTLPLHASFSWSHRAASRDFLCAHWGQPGAGGHIHLPPCFQHLKFTVTPAVISRLI